MGQFEMFTLAYQRESQEILWGSAALALEPECVWFLYHPNSLQGQNRRIEWIHRSHLSTPIPDSRGQVSPSLWLSE